MRRQLYGAATLGMATLVITGCATLRPQGRENESLSGITQLTFQSMGLVKSGEAYFSPDAGSIIFQAVPTGKTRYQIYTMDLDTGELEMVSTGKGGCTCAFYHPNGQKIIFASSHHGPYADEPPPDDETAGYKWAFDKHMDVFEANIDGTNLRRLTTTPGYDAECSYSSDGKRIVFVSERDDDLEIYVMNSDGTDQMRFTNAEGYDGGPFFSPDGKTILYRGDHRDDDEMNLQLRIINADGTNDRAITDNPIFNWCPYWHTDGESFIFTQVDHAAWARGKPPNYDLFMMTPEGEKFTRITYDKDFDGLPVFSPDGTRLLWTSKRGGLDEAQVFIAEFTLPEQLR